ncbi:hypothetical protein JOB18_043614 [Solea senegalensis]|uniref:Uncharacterized protein n=1 Tax=Solea senegalensis TaxID=28829 RepID=A0AAV6RVV8_SOLSE|nr:hypothetical protein JOB18_043614 [Solea senegalensis]
MGGARFKYLFRLVNRQTRMRNTTECPTLFPSKYEFCQLQHVTVSSVWFFSGDRTEPVTMAADVTVSRETLTGALTRLVNQSKALLQKAKQDAEVSLEKLVPYEITALFGLMAAGTDFYDSLGVKKKSDAEAVWRKFYNHAAVRELVDEFLELESEWDAFLENVDKGLQVTDRKLAGAKMADGVSPDTAFTDARSGKNVTLAEYLGRDHLAELEASKADLEARSLRVLMVAFGKKEGAELWLQQTGCTFDMLLDPQRKVFRKFGLVSSYAKVMKFDFLLHYSEYKTVGIDFPDIPTHLQEDLYQMGGNFLLDEAGQVLLSHPSKTPLDRPSVRTILDAVDAANSTS